MTSSRVRISFLSVFLTLLTLAFGVALAMRVRTYTQREATAPATTTTTASIPPDSGMTPRQLPAMTGTLVETTSPSSQTIAATNPTATVQPLTRAERFKQLLQQTIAAATPASQASASPAPAPATPQPKAPPRAQATPPRANTPQQNPRSSSPSTSSSSTSSSSTNTNHQQPADPNDPSSDGLAPQLLAAEFQPPQVRDGEDSMLIITAQDNLSGVRGISGTIVNPSGKALQGFAQQRESPESNRYVSKVTIPKDAEEGTWRVNFVNLNDNAGNSVTLSYSQGGVPQNAVLKVVSSRSDNTPPTLKNVYMDKRAMRTGEHNLIHVQADDDKSGVRLVSVVFVSPSKFARLGVGCQKGENEIWNCDFAPPVCLDCGEWQLEQVQMQDNANNLQTVRGDNVLVQQTRLNIQGDSCDSQPPVLQALVLDRIDVAAGGEVTVTATVVDDSCGTGGVSGQYSGPGQGNGRFFAFTQSGDSETWVGHFRVDALAKKGVWQISNITVNDKGQNTRAYFASDPLLQNGRFQVR